MKRENNSVLNTISALRSSKATNANHLRKRFKAFAPSLICKEKEQLQAKTRATHNTTRAGRHTLADCNTSCNDVDRNKAPYVTPNIVVVEIAMEQNIFAGSAPNMPAIPW